MFKTWIRTIIYFGFVVFFLSCRDKTVNPPDDTKPQGYQNDIAWPSLYQGTWVMSMCDPQGTGRTKTKILPGTQAVNFFSSTSMTESTPVTTSGNHIVYANYTGIYLLDITGQKLWTARPLSQDNYVPPLVLANGDIIQHGYNGILTRLNSTGSVVWADTFSNYTGLTYAVQIDKSGNLYFPTQEGYLYKIKPDGAIAWKDSLPGVSFIGLNRMAFDPTGTVLYIPTNPYLVAYDVVNRKMLWRRDNYPRYAAPLVDADGNIYYVNYYYSTNSSMDLFSLTSQGTEKFVLTLPRGSRYNYTLNIPTIDRNGTIFFGLDTLYAVTTAGQLKWKRAMGGTISEPIICDNFGTIVVPFSSSSGQSYAFLDSDGNLIKQCLFGDGMWIETPMVLPDGHICFSNGINLYRIE